MNIFQRLSLRYGVLCLFVLLLQCVSVSALLHAQSSYSSQPTFSPLGGGGTPTKIDPGKVVKFIPILGTYNATGEIRIEIDLSTENGFTIYQSEMEVIPPAGFTVETQKTPTPIKFNDPVTGGEVLVFEQGSFHLKFSGIDAVQNPFDFAIKFTGCTKDFCLFPFTQNIRVSLIKSELTGNTAKVSSKSDSNKNETIKIKSPIEEDKPLAQDSSRGIPVALLLLGISLFVMELFYVKKHKKLSLITPVLIVCIVLFWVYDMRSKPQEHSYAAQSLSWMNDEELAFATARQKGKHIFFESWADWCKPCKKMEVKTFRDPRVQEKLRQNYILLKVDMTDSNEATDIFMEKYAIDTLPTMILIDIETKRRKYIKRFVNPEELNLILKEFEAKPK